MEYQCSYGSIYISISISFSVIIIFFLFDDKPILLIDSIMQKSSSFQACLNRISYYSAEEATALDARLGTMEAGTCFTYTEDLHEVIHMAEDGMDREQFFYGKSSMVSPWRISTGWKRRAFPWLIC